MRALLSVNWNGEGHRVWEWGRYEDGVKFDGGTHQSRQQAEADYAGKGYPEALQYVHITYSPPPPSRPR